MAEPGVLRTNRAFRRLWVGSALSTLGSQISLIAFPLLVLGLGGGAAQAGLVASCSLVTRMVLRLPGGQLADRYDRRRLMIGADLVRLATVGTIPVAAGLGVLHYPQLLAVAVVEGAATAVFAPASTTAVRDVVPDGQLAAALAKDQSAMAAAGLIGPFLGGWLYTVDRILPFAVDAGSYAVSVVLLAATATRPRPAAGAAARDNRVTAGVRWLAGQPSLLRLLVFVALLNLVGSAAEVAMVVTLRDTGSGGSSIGLVMACAGVGAVIGSLAAPRVMRLFTAGQLFLVIGVVWAGGLAAFAATQRPWIVGPLLVVLVLLTPPAGIVIGQAVLSRSPRELLGRVSTAVDLLLAGLAALGPILTGLALQGLGIAPTWLVLAGLVGAATLVAALPMLRDGSLAAAPEAAPEAAAV
ncbi:MFS transporter [Kitasatospora sp. MMS16-BH015]|uniref:MFS transporter n=1 Tax=Kitasatospora sp. MMS16-BH015 TaxID=2018025 RepID=UPI000CA27298|nr:MFS transporter [Kitasatospora sp. MMS16-BH015]AUG78993.1 MFS transporter [Kitasatospora sp. MMS16-BH015]